MLRRLFRIKAPETARDGWNNLLRAGWWELGFLLVLAIVGIGAKTAFPSGLPVFVGIIVVILLVPPALAVLAVVGELAAVVRLRNREKQTRPPTGNPLIDHDVLVGVIIVALIVVGVIVYMILHPSSSRY